RLVDGEHTGGLAGRGAQSTGELREVVGRVQALDGAPPLAPPHQIVPLGDEVPERTSVVTERDATVHAAAGLLGDDRQEHAPKPTSTVASGVALAGGVDLTPVAQPLRDRAALRDLARGGQEALGISHARPP